MFNFIVYAVYSSCKQANPPFFVAFDVRYIGTCDLKIALDMNKFKTFIWNY